MHALLRTSVIGRVISGVVFSAALAVSAAEPRTADSRDLPPVDQVAGPPPGTVVFASPDPGRVSCASPSIAILPDGSYLVSNDTGGRTLVHRSADRGVTWRQLAEVRDQKWSMLFLHRGALHLIGVAAKAGHLIVRRSLDGGRTWTDPTDARHGLLVSRRYWSIGSKITNPYSGYAWLYTPHHQRNVLSLTSSADLTTGEERCRLLRYREGQVVTKAESRVGFQYVDWQFDGPDLIAACRTSWAGANYHDANFITFHRVKNFRTLTLADSPSALGQ